MQQRLAAHDRQVAAAPAAPFRPTPRPTYPGFPSPALSADEQARRQRERKALEKRLLDDFNALSKALYLPPFLREALTDPVGNLRPALPAGGRGCFMPDSFWQTQYEETPAGWKPKFIKGKNGKPGHWSTFNHWKNCCNTVKRMVGYNSPIQARIQIVREHGSVKQHTESLVLQPTATVGFGRMDQYLALHKPVMVGVHHVYGAGYNEKTTDHFIAVVGTGTDTKGKYYRFFDVGTLFVSKGTDPRNRLYYDPSNGSYSGRSYAAPASRIYTISQIKFK